MLAGFREVGLGRVTDADEEDGQFVGELLEFEEVGDVLELKEWF